jgi:uncharacterized coiled-coil protein SlyX
MTLEERMDRLEKAMGTQDALVRELRDAVTVTAQLEARQARILSEQGEWLLELEKQREKDRRESVQRGEDLDKRIADLVSGFGEFLRRGPG